MSRVAKNPVPIPAGVVVEQNGLVLSVKGQKGLLTARLNASVQIKIENSEIILGAKPGFTNADAQAGTARAIINNMVQGVSQGFERRLQIIGVGYRAAVKGDVVSLSLGFSHPVEFKAPEGIVIEAPSQTEIVVKGSDKQLVGQVAADIRAYRPPEPYKGKGVRYSDEVIVKKETKKK